MDFSRQLELYDAEIEEDSVRVIGVGATGSWVSLILSKLGVRNITMYDMDIVEGHNVPNQLYSNDDIGKLKSAICKGYCRVLGCPDTNILHVPLKVDKDNPIIPAEEEVIFCLVDSMDSRKEIFDMLVSTGKKYTWIETRMGLTGYRIYMIDTTNEKEIEKYRETLYSDDDAEVSACGTSQSIVTTAVQCASHAVGLWLAKKNNAEYVPNEIIFDVHSSFIMSRKFDKGEEE